MKRYEIEKQRFKSRHLLQNLTNENCILKISGDILKNKYFYLDLISVYTILNRRRLLNSRNVPIREVIIVIDPYQ